MAKFAIQLVRRITEYAEVNVEADTEDEAIELAIQQAEDGDVEFDPEDIDIVKARVI